MITYLKSVFSYAFKNWVQRADALHALLAFIVTIFFHVVGVPMPSDIQIALLVSAVYFAVAVVVFRLLSAPYFLWKDQQKEIANLKDIIDEPKRLVRADKANYIARIEIELSQIIGYLSSIALSHGIPNKPMSFWESLQEDIERANAKAQELSYDRELFDLCIETIQYASIVISDKTRHEQNEEDRNKLAELSRKALKRLQLGEP